MCAMVFRGLPRDFVVKEESMPQMVPVSGLSPAPCDYAHFAADSFDLSLLECGAGDGEVPYSPTSIHQLLSLFAEQPCSPPLMFHPPARVKDEPLESLESLESLECLEPPAEDHRLLREVLRDTSFQRRHNVRALDLETLARRAQDLVREEAEDRLYLSPGAFQRGQHPLDPVKGEVEDRQYLSPEAFQRRQQPQDPVKGEVENRGYLSPEAFQRRHHPLDSVKGEVEDHQYLSTAFQRQQPQDPVKGEVEERMYLSPGAFQRQEHSLDPVKGEVEERMYLSPEAFQRQQPPVDPAKGQALVPQAMDVEPEDEAGPLKEEALSPGSSQQDCLEHMEPVLSLAIQQLQRDVDDTCSVLGIASDPGQWTVDDVKAWLLWTLRQYNLPMIPMDYFAVDGVTLSALSEEEFQQRSPQCGSTLYAHLEIWKAARQELESRLDAGPWSNATAAPNSCSSGDMSDDEEEDCAPSPPAATSGSSTGAAPGKVTRGASHIHLWQFLKELLTSPQTHGSCIRWLERGKGVFKIEDSVRVARLWGKRKNRPAMNYDKLSRSIRQYYKKGIMKKTERSQRLVYQFCHPYCL